MRYTSLLLMSLFSRVCISEAVETFRNSIRACLANLFALSKYPSEMFLVTELWDLKGTIFKYGMLLVVAAYWATSWIKNSITGTVLSRVVLPLGKQAIETMTTDHSAAALFSMAFVTAPSEDVAKTIARGLVQNKLAACVNIIPKITSIYEWQDKLNEDSEVLMMIKTRTSRMEELTQFVKSNHPYDVCEVISTHIFQGNQPYLEWIGQIVPEKPVSSI